MLAVNCDAGRSLWQKCILLAVVCFSRQMYMLVLEEVCVVGVKFVGWSLLMWSEVNSIAGTSVGFWLVCVLLRARMCFLGRND